MGVSLRSVLEDPRVYVAYQKGVGAHRSRYRLMEEAELKPGERVLDVGCGPAYYLNRLPAVDYVGFDTCKSYVKYARRRSRGRGDFRCEFLAKEHVGELGQFDAVLLFGLLHHITDAECAALLDLCAGVLAPGGRVLSCDTALHAGQRRVSRWMSEHDRGAHVRRPEEYDDLASKCFDRVEGHLDDTLCRIPIALYLMRMTEPQVRVADPVWSKSSAREATREEGRW